jgi:hypothetical protein
VSNRNERFYREDMQRQLDGVARTIKNFLFKTHRRNMRVLESTYNTRHLPNEDIWFCDPVHPIDGIYQQIAAGVVKMAAALRELDERQDLKRRRSDSWDTGKQGRLQWDDPLPQHGKGYDSNRGHHSRGGHGGRGGRGGHSGQQYQELGGPRS